MRSSLSKLFSLSLLMFSCLTRAAELQDATDLNALGDQYPKDVIVLMVSQPDCSFCVKVKEDYLKPLIQTDGAPPVRVINLKTAHQFVGFDGAQTSAEQFTGELNAQFTPTLLFFDAQGHQLHERIIGLTTPDFYGYYLDTAIESSRQQLK